jgi:hypothetical protein
LSKKQTIDLSRIDLKYHADTAMAMVENSAETVVSTDGLYFENALAIGISNRFAPCKRTVRCLSYYLSSLLKLAVKPEVEVAGRE